MAVTESEIASRLRDAIVALKEVRTHRDALLREKSEPIAIVSMACRFPGNATTPEAYYRMLVEGVDTIGDVPPERWPIDTRADNDPRLLGARWGAFLKDVDLFDPAFFGISPREAEKLDPQQRLLLEVTWEALERGGLIPGALAGTKTGVFIGIMTTDYLQLNLAVPREQQDAYSATGNGHCFPPGRLAYTFGFQGPAVCIDTACSSSLVATHLGCASLRSRESDVVVVGGVNLMLFSLTTEITAKTGALAPDGRCKSFDARGNGYVRGEGCGALVLKRLSDALRDADPIVALIRGSAVNQDGRSTGLTTPNVLSQQAMLTQALENARLSPNDIGYIEAHGTGTPLGDPIEMEALRAVFGAPRSDAAPCFVGSVKTNIGHLEAAAGVAGLMKAALTLQGEKIPKNLHLRTLNPRISLDGTPLTIPTDVIPWPRSDKPRRAGISSFGMSGTNAHIVLEEAPRTEPREKPIVQSAYLLPISAKTTEALVAQVRSYSEWFVGATDVPLEDVVYTASVRRTQHEYRAVTVAHTHAEFTEMLAAVAKGEDVPGLVSNTKPVSNAPKVVFVFPGQGSQWLGMARELLADELVFRRAIEACDPLIQKESGFSILEQIRADEDVSRLAEINVVQPLLFAIQIGLAALWRSWGVIPDCVVGHSMGEVAAAHVAGMLTLEDAVSIICRRSLLMCRLRGKGAMAVVELPVHAAETAIAEYQNQLSVAVSNGPTSTVLSGDPDALEKVLQNLETTGIFCRRVKVEVASHSPQMDVLRGELLDALKHMTSTSSRIRMISTVTGAILQSSTLTPQYWWDNLRQPVRFFHVASKLIHEDQTVFVELSPHPVLRTALDETLKDAPNVGHFVESMLRQTPQRATMLKAFGALWTKGVRVDWTKIYPYGQVVPLPTYPWQRKRHWIEQPASIPVFTTPPKDINDWLFELDWRLQPIENSPSGTIRSQGSWIVFTDSGRIGKNTVIALRAKGIICTQVDFGPTYTQHSSDHYTIRASAWGDYARILRSTFQTGTSCRGIVYFGGLNAPSWEATTVDTLFSWQKHGFLGAIYLAQALVREHVQQTPQFWLVTQGAIAVHPNAKTRSVAQASLWGLGRTLTLEHPELRCSCIDLDPVVKHDTVKTLVQALNTDLQEDHIALRTEGRYVGRFRRTRINAAPETDLSIKDDRSYLITGGLGGLGLRVAQWLINTGARHIALTGRKTPTKAAEEAIEKMTRNGANVMVIPGDVAQSDDVLRIICVINAEMPPLRGIVHAAGVLEDRTLLELTSEHVEKVFAPKVAGAWNLHTFSMSEALDFFVMYSSGASLFGSAGQSNYAAANAFLDALAQARQVRGLPTMSIQWGTFSEIGLAAQAQNRGARLEGQGITSLSPGDGDLALEQLLKRPRPQIAVMRLNLPKIVEANPEIAARTLWSDLCAEVLPRGNEIGRQPDPITAPVEMRFLDILANTATSAQSALLEDHIRLQFAKVLRMEQTKIDPEEKIHHYGMDSLMAIEVRNRLQSSLGLQLSVSEIWTHASVVDLAAVLRERMGIPVGDRSPPIPARTALHEPTIQSPMDGPGQWVITPRPALSATMRLFCFPYAGGGAPVYSSWAEHLPTNIELCAIQPPGRHARIHEPFVQSVDEMVSALIPALIPYLDRPFAMFGHCLGAIVMFEVVRQLAQVVQNQPLHIFASGAPNPAQYLIPNVSVRSDQEFLTLLQAIGLAKQNVLDDRDIIQTMLPMIRADFKIAEQYSYHSAPQLNIPISTFAANADPFAPPSSVEQWQMQTSAYFSKHTYAGGHYFLHDERDDILRIIQSKMEYAIAARYQRETRTLDLQPVFTRTSPSKPKRHVICFPGIGGSVSKFKFLEQVVPAEVSVCGIDFPGHGTRNTELPLGNVQDLVNMVLPMLSGYLDLPCMFVGHDLGALVMYEVVERLRQSGLPLPTALVVVAAMAPQVHYFPPAHELPDEAFRASLNLLGFSPTNDITANRAYRADCSALANYSFTPTAPLPLPIHALIAERDSLISETSVLLWRMRTSVTFHALKAACDHHDFGTNASALMRFRDIFASPVVAKGT